LTMRKGCKTGGKEVKKMGNLPKITFRG